MFREDRIQADGQNNIFRLFFPFLFSCPEISTTPIFLSTSSEKVLSLSVDQNSFPIAIVLTLYWDQAIIRPGKSERKLLQSLIKIVSRETCTRGLITSKTDLIPGEW